MRAGELALPLPVTARRAGPGPCLGGRMWGLLPVCWEVAQTGRGALLCFHIWQVGKLAQDYESGGLALLTAAVVSQVRMHGFQVHPHIHPTSELTGVCEGAGPINPKP